jgi:hypothetical protein
LICAAALATILFIAGLSITGYYWWLSRVYTLDPVSKISALSSVATGLGTSTLVVVTAVYALFVYEQNKTLTDRERKVRQRELSVLETKCRRLIRCLKALPRNNSQGDSAWRDATIWDARDLHDLEAIASTLGVVEASQAVEVVNDLRWIGERVAHCKSRVDANRGIEQAEFQLPWPDWNDRISAAEKGTASLAESCRKFLGSGQRDRGGVGPR